MMGGIDAALRDRGNVYCDLVCFAMQETFGGNCNFDEEIR